MVDQQPFFSVIIPNWNGERHLPVCLDALRRQTWRDVETIVVDNASGDGSRTMLRDRYPEVRLLPLPENRFFSGGVNAGIGKFVPIAEVTEAMFDEIVTINLKGAFFTVQKALPLMARGSAVVLNASINAHIGLPGTTVYGATKAAVVNMAKTMSADLAERGIRVNAVSPGPVETPIFGRVGISSEQSRQTKEWLQNQTLVKRMGEPEEIAEAVLYLSSDVSSFVVGTELVIDGGMTI